MRVHLFGHHVGMYPEPLSTKGWRPYCTATLAHRWKLLSLRYDDVPVGMHWRQEEASVEAPRVEYGELLQEMLQA